MKRTLYISETKGIEVLRDGPSIVIKQQANALRRIPIRLIGRVAIFGNVKLQTEVINLLTENHIPITFMNMKGHEVAVTIPYNHHQLRHYEEQKIFFETEKNIERFKIWITSKRRKLQLHTIRRLSKKTTNEFILKGFREKDYQSFIIKFIHCKEEQWKTITETINNLLRTMVIESLLRAGIDIHMGIIHRRDNFGLALDICHIFGAEVDIQGIQFLNMAKKNNYIFFKTQNGWKISKEGIRDIIHRFENRKRFLYEEIEKVIDEYFELIRELRR
jgi:CRISPR/Cas system-associated endonuclease Cas1